MELFVLQNCPLCGQNSRAELAVDRDSLIGLVLDGKPLFENLNNVRRSKAVRGLSTSDRTLSPCPHLLLMHVFGDSDSSGRRERVYEAIWRHPAFTNHFDAATAQELTSRLIMENPRGHGVWGSFGDAFYDFALVENGEAGCETGEIEFAFQARVLYVADPEAFLIAYGDFVRAYACPCGAHGSLAERSKELPRAHTSIDKLAGAEDDDDESEDDGNEIVIDRPVMHRRSSEERSQS